MSLRQFYESLPSTQLRARELVTEGCPDGTWVVAGIQTAGLGRLDHRWASPPGGLYLSRIGPDLPDAGSLVPLAFGAGLHDLLEEAWSVPTVLKWPNDLLLPGSDGRSRKIAGILSERVQGPSGPRIVLGVGLNVRSPPEAYPADIRDRVGRIADRCLPPPPLEEVEDRVLAVLGRIEADLGSRDGPGRWLDRSREILFGRGRSAWVDGVPVGRIREIGPDGSLLVDGPGGSSSIRTGELVVEEPA